MPINAAQFLRQLPRRAPSANPYICPQCRLQQKRSISTSFRERMKEGEEQWKQRAKDIRQGTRKSMLAVLEERGFVHQVAGERDALDKLMIDKRVGIYCGVDPTAPSLHIGHMLPVMALFWMHLHGFHTVSLVGGTTSGIGDPTGRTTDRTKMTSTERKTNIVSMHYQFKKLWMNLELIGRKHGYVWDRYWHREIANNNIWWNNLPFADVIKTLGRGMRMGSLLARDTVKTKMESGSGMSFAEFCYPIMQAWDWWHMYHTKGIQLQIGGADQFGNIVAGVDAVKYLAKNHPHPDVQQPEGVTELTTPYGFTVPLLTTASGEKFGKSAGNAVWLDHTYTPMFDLYGFFVRTADADVERLLKLFTFLPLEKIKSIMEEHQEQPSKRVAQHTLAYEFVELVHGAKNATAVQEQHHKMFSRSRGGSVAELTATEQSSDNSKVEDSAPPGSLNEAAKSAVLTSTSTTNMHVVLPLCCVEYRPIAQLLHSAGLVASKSEGHRLATNQGAYIGRTPDNRADMRDAVEYVPAKNSNPLLTMQYMIRDDPQTQKPGEEGIVILRKGKWNVKVVRVVSDEKFKEMLERGEVPEPPGYRDVLSELAKDRAKSANAQRRLDLTEQELLEKRAERVEVPAAADEELIDHDEPAGNRRARGEAFNEGQRKGYEYLKSRADVAADAQASSPRGSIGDTRRMLHSLQKQEDAARTDKMRAEYGNDRRNWPPLQSNRMGGDERRGGAGAEIGGAGGFHSRGRTGGGTGGRYSVPPPPKLEKAEKMALHRRRHHQLETERRRGALQQTETKREELKQLQERRMARMGIDDLARSK